MKARDEDSARLLARAMPAIGRERSGDDGADAVRLSEAVEELVRGLGLESRLGEYGVGGDQVEKIAEVATKRGPMFEGVKELVKSKL